MGTGKDTCLKIKETESDMRTKLAGIGVANNIVDGLTNLTGVGAIVNGIKALKADNKSENSTTVDIFGKITQEDIQKIENTCNSSTSINQENHIDNAKCLEIILKARPNEDWTNIKQLLQANGPIKQFNESKIKNSCFMDNILNKLQNTDFDVETAALLKLTQEANGTASNKSYTDSCSQIRNEVEKKHFLDELNECIQKTTLTQKNYLDCPLADEIIQKNKYDAVTSCIMQKSNIFNDTILLDNKNVTKTDQEQKATNNLFMIGAIVFFIITMIILVIIYNSLSNN
jgi:hypothetical protein